MQVQKIENSLVVQLSGIRAKKINVPCDTFKSASEIALQYIRKYDLGGSTFKSAVIFHPTKGAIAHVSYNGRVWQGTELYANGRTEIKDLSKNDI